MSHAVLEVHDLSVGYNKTPILQKLNFTGQSGQFISLLGPNGAGKTTLLRTLARLLTPLAGEIRVQGSLLTALRPMDLARIMAVVLTDRLTPPLFSVFEFVALGRYPHTGSLGRLAQKDRLAVSRALEMVHALPLAKRPFSDLSDGERQKVLVARALAQEPQLLLLDEPTIHLDLKHRIELMAILRDLCASHGITVLASLHDVDVAAKVSDRVALIKAGGLLDWGPPESVLTGESVAGLYDFDKAAFDRDLGGIELRGEGQRGRAFVVGGMGSGAQVYRLLAKKGFSIATGVVHTNDLDYFVAQSLGAQCYSVAPMEVVNGQAMREASTQLQCCDLVIDSGFGLSHGNKANLELLQSALDQGKLVFTLRENPLQFLAPKNQDRCIACDSAGQLLDALDHLSPCLQEA